MHIMPPKAWWVGSATARIVWTDLYIHLLFPFLPSFSLSFYLNHFLLPKEYFSVWVSSNKLSLSGIHTAE